MTRLPGIKFFRRYTRPTIAAARTLVSTIDQSVRQTLSLLKTTWIDPPSFSALSLPASCVQDALGCCDIAGRSVPGLFARGRTLYSLSNVHDRPELALDHPKQSGWTSCLVSFAAASSSRTFPPSPSPLLLRRRRAKAVMDSMMRD